MALYDLRSVVASWVRKQGGRVDPAIYAGVYNGNVSPTGQMSIKPDGKRGVFLAFGLSRAKQTSNPGASKIQLNVEGLRITYNGILRSALVHSDASNPGGRSIDFSAWPAPIPIGVESSLSIAESCIDSAESLANAAYVLAGFHTDPAAAQAVLANWGQLRAFALDCQSDVTNNGGNSVVPFTMPEQDPRLWIQEFSALNVDATPGSLDFIRLSYESAQMYFAQRTSGTLDVALPGFLGQPVNYLGRYMGQGDVLTLIERISSTTRRDLWNFLGVVGGKPDVVEVGGIL